MFYIVRANDNDAFIPEVWAQESLMILENELVAAHLIHRDFSDEVAAYGDVVNTRKPATFTTKRKVDGDSVVAQDATATNVPIKLDQHLYNTFIINDGEASKSFKNLVEVYLKPAVMAMAQTIDEIILGQVYQFVTDQSKMAGKLGTAPTIATVIALREAMNINKVPQMGRVLVVPPNAEGSLLAVEAFHQADKRGDGGIALREAHLGRVLGFDTYMSQLCPGPVVSPRATTTINNASGYAAGSTTLVIADSANDPVPGEWITIAGDMTPQLVLSFAETTDTITITPGLKHAVAHQAVVSIYDSGTINNSAGYDIGHNKPLTVANFSPTPVTGQMISTGITANTLKKYSALSTPSATSLLLDRSLEAAVSNGALIASGPAGDYSFAFHRNAIGLITRPLAAPQPGTGALSYVANYNGLGLRVTIQYDSSVQGHRVTVDMLAGIKVLDSALGAVMFS